MKLLQPQEHGRAKRVQLADRVLAIISAFTILREKGFATATTGEIRDECDPRSPTERYSYGLRAMEGVGLVYIVDPEKRKQYHWTVKDWARLFVVRDALKRGDYQVLGEIISVTGHHLTQVADHPREERRKSDSPPEEKQPRWWNRPLSWPRWLHWPTRKPTQMDRIEALLTKLVEMWED